MQDVHERDVRCGRVHRGTRTSSLMGWFCVFDLFCWQCLECLPGSYGTGALAYFWECDGCGPGRYSTVYGATSLDVCVSCGAGKSSPLLRSDTVSRERHFTIHVVGESSGMCCHVLYFSANWLFQITRLRHGESRDGILLFTLWERALACDATSCVSPRPTPLRRTPESSNRPPGHRRGFP